MAEFGLWAFPWWKLNVAAPLAFQPKPGYHPGRSSGGA